MRCRKAKRKCVLEHERDTCTNCYKAGVTCTPPSPRAIHPTNRKRKMEEVEHISDTFVFLTRRLIYQLTYYSEPIQTNQATLPADLPQNSQHMPSHHIRKAVRIACQSQLISLKSSRARAQSQQRKPSGLCSICQICPNPSNGRLDILMVQCEIETCGSWYHVSCIFFSKRQKLFSLGSNLKDIIFVCPNCYDKPKDGYAQDIFLAMTANASLWRSVKEVWPKPSVQTNSSPQRRDKDRTLQQEVEGLGLRDANATGFELAREEIFQGFDNDEVHGLFRKLHQAIYNYNLEIHEVIDRFGDGDDICTQKPLAAWNLIDASQSIVAGQPWYRIDGPARKQSNGHSPITAALRSMLNTPDDKPLEIDPSMRSLNFFKVHMGLVSWFVYDVLNNELDIYELPNMKPMRAMMSAVNHFGEASKHSLLVLLVSSLKIDQGGQEMDDVFCERFS